MFSFTIPSPWTGIKPAQNASLLLDIMNDKEAKQVRRSKRFHFKSILMTLHVFITDRLKGYRCRSIHMRSGSMFYIKYQQAPEAIWHYSDCAIMLKRYCYNSYTDRLRTIYQVAGESSEMRTHGAIANKQVAVFIFSSHMISPPPQKKKKQHNPFLYWTNDAF